MYCTTCGNEIPNDSKFCTSCGASVECKPKQAAALIPPQANSASHEPEPERVSPASCRPEPARRSEKIGPAAKAGIAVVAVGVAAAIVFGSCNVSSNFVTPAPQQNSNAAPTVSEDQNNNRIQVSAPNKPALTLPQTAASRKHTTTSRYPPILTSPLVKKVKISGHTTSYRVQTSLMILIKSIRLSGTSKTPPQKEAALFPLLPAHLTKSNQKINPAL